MKNNFWGLLWSSFLEIQGVLVGFLGIVLSIFAWVFSSKTQVSLALIITVAIFLIIVIITLFQAAYKAFRQMKKLETEVERLKKDNQNLETAINQRIIPKILRVQKELNTNTIKFMLAYSEFYSTNQLVSFYFTDNDDFEILIGVGFINNIQDNKKIIAILDQPIIIYQDILDKLVNNDFQIIEKTAVKPGIPKNFNQP